MDALVAVVISLAVIAGCDGAARNQQKSDAVLGAASDSVTLSSTRRVQSLAIPPEAEGMNKFRLTVSRVHNPRRVPIGLTAALVSSRDTIEIGSVALYPSDSGGVFAISLPQPARAAISRSLSAGESGWILVRLSEILAEGVSLTVGIGGWER